MRGSITVVLYAPFPPLAGVCLPFGPHSTAATVMPSPSNASAAQSIDAEAHAKAAALAMRVAESRDRLTRRRHVSHAMQVQLLRERATPPRLEAAGTDAALVDRIETEDGPIEIAPLFLQVRRATIYGGSSEIQRNILSKRVLGLPG